MLLFLFKCYYYYYSNVIIFIITFYYYPNVSIFVQIILLLFECCDNSNVITVSLNWPASPLLLIEYSLGGSIRQNLDKAYHVDNVISNHTTVQRLNSSNISPRLFHVGYRPHIPEPRGSNSASSLPNPRLQWYTREWCHHTRSKTGVGWPTVYHKIQLRHPTSRWHCR